MTTITETLFSNIPTPVEQISRPDWDDRGLEVWVKRDDLNHPVVQGNKWRKLKYTARHIRKEGIRHVWSFGGPYSNHLHALAFLCRELDVGLTCLIRGDGFDGANPTLRFLRDCGARCLFLSRSDYRKRHDAGFIDSLRIGQGDLLLPEGGASTDGVRGASEIAGEVLAVPGLSPDLWIVPVGTGTTMAGILTHPGVQGTVTGITAVADHSLPQRTARMLRKEVKPDWHISFDFLFGGFARYHEDLLQFLKDFESRHGFLLDPVYTVKAFYAFESMVDHGAVKDGSQVVIVHTGGLQGRVGFEQRFGIRL